MLHSLLPKTGGSQEHVPNSAHSINNSGPSADESKKSSCKETTKAVFAIAAFNCARDLCSTKPGRAVAAGTAGVLLVGGASFGGVVLATKLGWVLGYKIISGALGAAVGASLNAGMRYCFFHSAKKVNVDHNEFPNAQCSTPVRRSIGSYIDAGFPPDRAVNIGTADYEPETHLPHGSIVIAPSTPKR